MPPSFSQPRRDLGTLFPSCFYTTCKWLPAEFTRQCSQPGQLVSIGAQKHSFLTSVPYLSHGPFKFQNSLWNLLGTLLHRQLNFPLCLALVLSLLTVFFLRVFPMDVVTKSTKILTSETVSQRNPIYGNDDHRKDKKTQIHKRRQKSSVILSPIY